MARRQITTLEITKRIMSEYVTELVNIQIYVETSIEQFLKQLIPIADLEMQLIKGDCSQSQQQPLSGCLTIDDQSYLPLYLAKLYNDLAISILTDTKGMQEISKERPQKLLRLVTFLAQHIALDYLNLGKLAYKKRGSSQISVSLKDDRMDWDADSCSNDGEKALLKRLSDRYIMKYKEKFAGNATRGTHSVICQEEHKIPHYFKMFILEHEDKFQIYRGSIHQQFAVGSANHLPPHKLLYFTLNMVLTDAMEFFYFRRQSCKADMAILNIACFQKCEECFRDKKHVLRKYTEPPIKAFLAQVSAELYRKLDAIGIKFETQCDCGRMFHLSVIKRQKSLE